MAVLSDLRLLEKIYDKELKIEPFVFENLQPASIDLTLDSKIKIPKNEGEKLDPIFLKGEGYEAHFQTEDLEDFPLLPGHFVIGEIKETITLPRTVNGHIQNRNSIIRLGVNVGLSSYINPGYSGKLPIVIHNLGNFKINLVPGMRICQLVLHDVHPEPYVDYSEKKDAKYHCEKGDLLSKLHLDTEFQEFLLREPEGSSAKLISFLEKRFQKLKDQNILQQLPADVRKRIGIIGE